MGPVFFAHQPFPLNTGLRQFSPQPREAHQAKPDKQHRGGLGNGLTVAVAVAGIPRKDHVVNIGIRIATKAFEMNVYKYLCNEITIGDINRCQRPQWIHAF